MNRALFVCLIAALLSSLAQPGPVVGGERRKADPRLVGCWERDGKVTEFLADGTGKNYDRTRFRWELREGQLEARTLSATGELGDVCELPIAFSVDEKEYTIILEGGNLRVAFVKLRPDGRKYEDRTAKGREYPPAEKKGEADSEKTQTQPLPSPSVRPDDLRVR
jgi:hypothetical protein